MTEGLNWTVVSNAEDVTEEVMELVRGIESGWYAERRIDWEDVWDRLDGTPLADGTLLDMGGENDSAAMRKIKKNIAAERRRGG